MAFLNRCGERNFVLLMILASSSWEGQCGSANFLITSPIIQGVTSTLTGKGISGVPFAVSTTAVARIIASDEQLTKWFVSEVTEKVDARMVQRQAKRDKIWSIIFGLATLVGIGVVVTLSKSFITDAVDKASEKQRDLIIQALKDDIRQSLVDETKEIRNEIKQQGDYHQFSYMSLSLKFAQQGFTNEERDTVMVLLESISSSRELRSKPGFRGLLENVIASFASANLHNHLEKLVSLFETETTGTPAITHTLVQHYGQELVGSPLPPERWKAEEVALFDKFETACRLHKIPEIALPYRLLIEFRRANNNATDLTRGLLHGVTFLNARDRVIFHQSLITISETSFWMKRSTPQGAHISEVCKRFRADHRDEIVEQLSDQEVQEGLLEVATGLCSSPDQRNQALGSAIRSEVTPSNR